MATDRIHGEPALVEAIEGTVVITCSETVRIRMTPTAAEETSERLLEGAMKARGQSYFADDRRGQPDSPAPPENRPIQR